MCRIWGISYGPGGPESEPWTPTEMAQIMFPSLVASGPHAFGWTTWDGESAEVDIYKFEGRSDTPWAIEQMEQMDAAPRWIIGHTRWATHGSPKVMRNNHPLHHGDIVGVHNGVIRNYSDILKVTGRQDPLTEVDSESIFAAVNKWGGKAGLARVNGDMVAVYCNLLELDTVYLAKSHGRPLVMATTPAGSLIWASEEQALDALGMDLVNYSELGTNRLLTVKQGKVVSRVQYRTALRTRAALPAPATTKQKASKSSAKHTGEVVAKHDPMMDEIRAIAAKRGITDGTPVDGLYYFGGLLLTKREYEQALADQLSGTTTQGA